MSAPQEKKVLVGERHTDGDDDSTHVPEGMVEMSPNKRYIRFDELISKETVRIQSSYKAFDTKNGMEIAWHKINLNTLEESEQSRVTQGINLVKKIQSNFIIEYLMCWFSTDTRTLNIITTHLVTLKEFISKVHTLRWRIVKKWLKQILKGLDVLHTHTPNIAHRDLACSHIYIDSGHGGCTNIGDLWLAAILSEDKDKG